MKVFLRENKKYLLQNILCFFNIHHSYRYSAHSKKNKLYYHLRKCSNCCKSQKQTWYQSGCNLIPTNWKTEYFQNRVTKEETYRMNRQGILNLVFGFIVFVVLAVLFQFAN